MKHYVIIGNGVAAAGCIEGIRSVDAESAVTVISAENHPVYCRPLISCYLEKKTDLERMHYRSESFYTDNNVKVLYGRSAAKIDAAAKTVTLDNGETIAYDAVCNASGSSPFVPPMAGLDTVEKKFSFMTIDDTLALEQAITPESRVLIIGAGLIGLKCAEGLHDRVGSITVCDLAPRVLSSILDDTCAAMMQNHLEKNGISFILGTSAKEFQGGHAVMQNGAEVDFDVLVLAVGVRANTQLVKAAGGEVNRGIVVNDKCQTSLKDIYAAGDCTEYHDISSDMNKVMALMPNAYMQGRTAGVNMAGGDTVFNNAIPMNSIGFFGFHCHTAGSQPEGCTMYEEADENHIKRLFVKDDRLTGFMLLGHMHRTGIYTALIRNQTPLSSVDFARLQIEPQLAAMGSDFRNKVLKGVV
ncbi:MAG: NAD(P)/FAD-dependent oxidoreductase [Oscillospiraceae bacterium]|nr:NAD(P)/FAD-dependent oxidoreductase [Oscillospiraceae bacterium]